MSCTIGTDIERAADLIRRGGLVAFPTETVYGLAANALDPTSVARVFQAKQRPRFDPLIVHVADPSGIDRLVAALRDPATWLIDAFWPGPLTLVLPKSQAVCDLATAGLPTVAVRMPAHPMALELLARAELPLAAPSANLFGHVSPTTALHVADQLGDRIDYILDGGACSVGIESTVLDLTGNRPILLRPGGLALERIEALIGAVGRIDQRVAAEGAQRSPGMLSRHYATRTKLYVVPAHEPLPETGRMGLLATRAEPRADRYVAVEVLSQTGDLVEAAANLFSAMRRLDALGLDAIVARPVPEAGLGLAINDRLRRAAARHVS